MELVKLQCEICVYNFFQKLVMKFELKKEGNRDTFLFVSVQKQYFTLFVLILYGIKNSCISLPRIIQCFANYTFFS